MPADGSAPAAPENTADPLDIAAGARVRLRRKALGISQSHLADALGVSFQQVQKYERGANRLSLSTLVRVAAALDTTVAWIAGETDGAPVASDPITRLLGSAAGSALIETAAQLTIRDLRILRATAVTMQMLQAGEAKS